MITLTFIFSRNLYNIRSNGGALTTRPTQYNNNGALPAHKAVSLQNAEILLHPPNKL